MARDKTGGRKKGTPNKNNAKTKEAVALLAEGEFNEFKQTLKKLEPKDYVKTYLTMLEFVIPKMKAVEVDQKEGSVNIVNTILTQLRDDEKK